MPRSIAMAGLAVAVALLLIWGFGGFAVIEAWARSAQRETQEAMAGAVRALRGGQAGAVWGLLALAFGYGVAHAAGPGHGKVLIGSYGVARRVPLLPLAAIALAASLAQAAVAVGLVYATLAALGWTRDRVLGAAEGVLAPVGHLLIAGLGVWLVWRGIMGVRRAAAAADHAHHHHHHHDHVHDASCTHAHGPTLDQISALTSWRDVAALIAGIAIRPCSGALFLLILTWQLGIGAAGIAGAFAMGLGTALVTIAVAAIAVWAREGAFASLSGTRIARAVPLLEMLAGAVIVIVAISLFGVAG